MQELSLEILIDLMQTGNIWCTVTHDKLCLFTTKYCKYSLKGLMPGDITLDNSNTINWRHLLEVDTDHS